MSNGYTYGANQSYAPESDTYSGTAILQLRRSIPQNLLDRLEKPNATVSILITVTAGMWLKGAVQHSGRTYKFSNVPVEVSGVFRNNGDMGLTLKTSLALCVATAGTFFYDSAAQTLYVHAPDPATRSIYDDTYQAKLAFRFARTPKNLRSVYWHGRLVSAPNLSLRIDSKFSGVGQVGGGSLTLANRDGYFDTFDESIQWDAGTVSMEIGIDLAGGRGDLSEADYQPVGSWRVEKTGRSDGNFILTLRERKTNLELKIPKEVFDRASYPNIEDNKIGKPIPRGYGKLFGVAPIVIDKNARKFKLAGHAIRSIEQVRIKSDTGGWNVVTPATQDLNRAEFTLSNGDWANNQTVSVDFFGRTNADGSLMENPSDVMQDVLDYCGETDLDHESFNVSRKWYRIGKDRFGVDVAFIPPCIYIDTQRTGLDVASEINNICGSFLFVDHSGLWHFGAFRPSRAQELDPMAGKIIQTFTEKDIFRDSISKDVDSSKLYAKLTVEYAKRISEGWAQRLTPTLPRNQYIHDLSPQFTDTKTIGLSNEKDAEYWGQRFLTTEAEPLVKYSFDLPWKSFFILPGDKLAVSHTRFNLNSVLEVYEAHYNFNSPPSVRFVTGNLRGWGDTFGYYAPNPSASYTPATNGLLCWLKPESHIYSDGQILEIWRDASGNEKHARGANTYGGLVIPKFRSSDYPVVQFESTGQAPNLAEYVFLNSDIGTQLQAPAAASRACEAFLIFKLDTLTPTDSRNCIWRFGSVPSKVPASTGDIQEAMGCVTPITGISAANLASGWNLYNCSRSNGNLTVRVNGVIVYNADPLQVVNFPIPTIGSGSGGNLWFSGFAAEELVYNRVLSTSERATIVQYLSDKFALGLVAASTPGTWDPAWTDAQVATARQNFGYYAAQDANGDESDMANVLDYRSHRAGRYW